MLAQLRQKHIQLMETEARVCCDCSDFFQWTDLIEKDLPISTGWPRYKNVSLYTGLNQRNGIWKNQQGGRVDKTEGHSHFRLILKCFLLLCAPNTSGFFYIKTNFFNKRSFTRVAQSAKVHFHKPPPWEEALWDIFIRQRGNQMQFGVGR